MPARCPYCRSEDLRPASVQHRDSWVQRKLSQAYRCRKCGRRSWRLEPAIIGLALAIVLVAATPAGFLGWHLMTAEPEQAPQAAQDPLASLAKRAKSGDIPAQLELGRRHADGDGTRVDTTEASRWYARAAEAGDREGQYRYGQALLEGSGVVQDYRSALEWLTRAANQNHAKAQRRLGQMYADGRGTPVDKVQAYVWLSLASAQGEQDAARLRDAVLMHLPVDKIDTAQETARALHARLSGAAPAEPATAVAPTSVPIAVTPDDGSTPQ